MTHLSTIAQVARTKIKSALLGLVFVCSLLGLVMEREELKAQIAQNGAALHDSSGACTCGHR